MALPALVDLILDQGQAVDETIVYKDKNGDLVDNSAYTAQCLVKENKADDAAVLTITVTMDGASGEFSLDASAVLVRALTFDRGFWSLEVSPSGGTVASATDNVVLCMGSVIHQKDL